MTVNYDTNAIIRNVNQAAVKGVLIGREKVLANAVKKILSPPKSGRVYKRRTISHQASAPGEAPANDTGRLAQSGRTEELDGGLTGIIKFSTLYAAALEYGTNKMEPRPYARPALQEETKGIQETINRLVGEAIK